MISWESFAIMQTALINAAWPFVSLWTMAFVVGAIVVGLLIFYLVITREMVSRI